MPAEPMQLHLRHKIFQGRPEVLGQGGLSWPKVQRVALPAFRAERQALAVADCCAVGLTWWAVGWRAVEVCPGLVSPWDPMAYWF
jgi:hypothetical protein